jgi:ABC-type glycerol-3-phosphate transport system substrate-binding protein
MTQIFRGENKKMKSYAKFATLLMIVVMVVASLVGCTPAATTEPTEEPQPTEAVVEPTKAPVEEPTAVPTEEPTAVPTEAPPEPVTIRYAAHNLGTEEENNAERQLIAAYMEMNPNVTIEIVDMSAEGGWEANLTAYAAKGELPDVFSAFGLPLYIKNGWMADLTDVVASDPEWALIPESLRNAVTYNGAVSGVPSGQFIVGFIVNKDLFEAANLDAPAYGFSLEEFEEAVTGVNNPADGVLGMDELWHILAWYPNAADPNLDWFSFDGEKMNYNSAAFKEAMAKTAEWAPYTWNTLTDEQKTNFKSVGPWELLNYGEVGLKFEYSWSFAGLKQNATFAWDFVGIPGGNQAVVFDFIGVGKTTANLEEAYKFAKWMGFSPEAYAKRVEIANAAGSVPNMPVAVDDASLALYTGFFADQPGIAAALDNLDNSMLESPQKVVPGFVNARWEGKTGIVIDNEEIPRIDWFWDYNNFSKFKFEDYSAQLEEFANKVLADAKAEMDE